MIPPLIEKWVFRPARKTEKFPEDIYFSSTEEMNQWLSNNWDEHNFDCYVNHIEAQKMWLQLEHENRGNWAAVPLITAARGSGKSFYVGFIKKLVKGV